MLRHDSAEFRLPLLLRLATSQAATPSPLVRYNDDVDELEVLVDGNWIAAVDADKTGPMTKKKDIEVGEDEKDKW